MYAKDEKQIYEDWEIHNPAWKTDMKTKRYLIYGSAFFVAGSAERWAITYPVTAKHFYFLFWYADRWDIIFASYSKKEMRRFIKEKLGKFVRPENFLYVKDVVKKKDYKGDDFLKEFWL
jgi:hypothetical protein